jgi:MFS family permease
MISRYLDIFVITLHGVLMGFSFGIVLASLPQFTTDSRAKHGLGSTSSWFSIIVAIYSAGVALGSLLSGWMQRRRIDNAKSRSRSRQQQTTHHLPFLISDCFLLIGAMMYWIGETAILIALGLC